MDTRSSRKDDPMELCRTCMAAAGRNKRNRNHKLVPIFTKLDEASVANIITDCTGVQICENDGLPTGICSDCFKNVKLLACFIKETRESDSELRRLFKVVPKEDDVKRDTDDSPIFEIKCEPLEQMYYETAEEPSEQLQDETAEEEAIASDNEDFKPNNDTDSDWKGSDDEVERSAKRKKLDLESKPKPRKRNGSPKKRRSASYVPRKLVQSEESLKLTDEERELFTVIEIPPKSHTCCGCLQIFESAEELGTHRETNHVWKKEKLMKPMPSKHTCEGCLRRYDTPRSVSRHQERVQLLRTIWECNKCKIRLKLPGKRREHVKLHAEGMPVAVVVRFKETTQQKFGWICCATKCGQTFSTEKDLIEHAHASHWADKQEADQESAEKPEQCQICFRRFTDRKKLVWHQRCPYYKHNNFQCAACGLKFDCTDKLTSHEVKVHASKVFQCKICDKTFTKKASLESHIEVVHNTHERNHQCTVCGMQFRQKNTLRVHMNVHKEVADFKCEVCPKAFKSKFRLQLHMRTHTGEKPYQCRICGHAFANSTNCRRHEMIHTGDKPHKCSYCEKSFILKRMLREHEAAHIAGKPKVRKQQETAVDDHEETVEMVEIIDFDGDDEENDAGNSDVCYEPEVPSTSP